MTFQEFDEWCNDRACDGYWNMNTAIACITIIRKIYDTPFWRRKRIWEKEYQEIAEQIVEQINTKIDELLGETDDAD